MTATTKPGSWAISCSPGFGPARQLGLTATPHAAEGADTDSLRQGVEDGPSPHRAPRVVTGLRRTDRFDKTVVCCVDQEHADEMHRELNNFNAGLVARKRAADPAARVTDDEVALGRALLGKIQDVEQHTPVAVAISQMVGTGVAMPTGKNTGPARSRRLDDRARADHRPRQARPVGARRTPEDSGPGGPGPSVRPASATVTPPGRPSTGSRPATKSTASSSSTPACGVEPSRCRPSRGRPGWPASGCSTRLAGRPPSSRRGSRA